MKKTEFILKPQSIDFVADIIEKELAKLEVERKEILRLRLSIEEALLIWLDNLGEDTQCSIRYGKRQNTFTISLFAKGKKSNPLEQTEELDETDDFDLMVNMLMNLNLAPSYSYRNGINSLTFKISMKQEKFPMGIIWAILGAIVSFLIFQYTPSIIGESVYTYITYPIQALLLNGISMVTGPLLFLAVITGIIRTDNVNTIRRRGGVMLSDFILQMIFAAIMTILVCFLGFDYQWDTGSNATLDASVFIDLIVDIVPTTIFTPFMESNALQLVFLAIVSGVALLIVRDKTEGLCSIIDQTYSFFNVMMGWIAKMLPIFIYCTLVNILLENGDLQILSFAFLIIVSLSLMAVFLLFRFIHVVYSCKIKPKLLYKKLLPSFILLATAASSTATFWHTKKVCVEDLGVQEDCTNTSLPLGSVLYMPACVILFTASALYTASAYQTNVSISFFILLVFLCVVMTMAMPPVAGSEIMCLTGLFMGLGIDTAGVPLIVALTVVINGCLVVFNIVSLELTLVANAKKLGELEEDILHNETSHSK